MLPEFVHDLAQWTRRSGPALWSGKAATGSPFYWPKGVTNPGPDVQRLRQEAYDQALKWTKSHHMAQAQAVEAQQKATVRAFRELADFHATTLEQASLHYVGKDISYLAAKTEMKEFRLDRELFEKEPGKPGLMSCGFMMWDTPIGEAEPRGQLTAMYDEDGNLLDVDVVDDMMEGFRDSETPVNALSWRILPESDEVLVTFYTDGQSARRNYERYAEQQKADLPPGMSIDKDAMALQMSDPQPLEREQVLPLGRTLAWFEKKDVDEGGRLVATIQSDPEYLRAAERNFVGEDFIAANEKVLPMLSQMVKTFVATLSIRRLKLAQREEVPPPKPSVKRMRRDGASEDRQTSPVQVIRIGKPLQHREGKGGGGGGGKWKVKTVIGPVIRTKQYVPAYGELRECVPPKVIEPYVAGPADAPWSEKARVYLID